MIMNQCLLIIGRIYLIQKTVNKAGVAQLVERLVNRLFLHLRWFNANPLYDRSLVTWTWVQGPPPAVGDKKTPTRFQCNLSQS